MNIEISPVTIPDKFENIQRFEYNYLNELKHFEDDTVKKLVCYPSFYQSSPPYQTLPEPTEDEKNLLKHYSNAQGVISELGLYFCSNSHIRGSGYVVKSGRRLYAPDLIQDYIEDNILRGVFNPINNGIQRKEHHITRPAALLIHEGYAIYGHWLVDLIPKMWMFFSQYGKVPDDIIFPICDDVPSWGIKILETVFGIRQKQLFPFSNSADDVLVDRLVAPSLVHNSHVFHPAAAEAFSYIKRKTVQQDFDPPRSYPNKIYVSRQKFRNKSISMKRFMDNEDEIIAVAQRHGFEVVYPEDYSWEQQVGLFLNAKFVAGEPGSGMHNTIFCGSDAHILSIGDSRMQGALAAVQRQQITLLGPRQAYLEDDVYHFNYDPDRFDSALSIMLGNSPQTVVGYGGKA